MNDNIDWSQDETIDSEQSKPAATVDMLSIMDDFAKAVEIFTGFKQQFVDAGWDEPSAEAMVIHFLKTSQPKVQ